LAPGAHAVAHVGAHVPGRPMPHGVRALIVANLLVGHVGEEVPGLVVLGRMARAEMVIVPQAVGPLGRTALAHAHALRPVAAHDVALRLLLAGRADADVHESRTVGVRSAHRRTMWSVAASNQS